MSLRRLCDHPLLAAALHGVENAALAEGIRLPMGEERGLPEATLEAREWRIIRLQRPGSEGDPQRRLDR